MPKLTIHDRLLRTLSTTLRSIPRSSGGARFWRIRETAPQLHVMLEPPHGVHPTMVIVFDPSQIGADTPRCFRIESDTDIEKVVDFLHVLQAVDAPLAHPATA